MILAKIKKQFRKIPGKKADPWASLSRIEIRRFH